MFSDLKCEKDGFDDGFKSLRESLFPPVPETLVDLVRGEKNPKKGKVGMT